MSAWFPLGDSSDYAISAGVVGSLAIGMASASLEVKDPAMQLYSVDDKTYIDLKISGTATLGKYVLGIDKAHLKVVGTDGFFLTINAGESPCEKGAFLQMNGQTGIQVSFDLFLGKVHPDEIQIPAVPFGGDPKQVIDGVKPLFEVQSVHG